MVNDAYVEMTDATKTFFTAVGALTAARDAGAHDLPFKSVQDARELTRERFAHARTAREPRAGPAVAHVVPPATGRGHQDLTRPRPPYRPSAAIVLCVVAPRVDTPVAVKQASAGRSA